MSAKPLVPTATILGEIQRRPRTSKRGAKIEQLVPLLGVSERAVYSRFRALQRQGLVRKLPGAEGEYILTEAGLRHYATEKENPQ